MSVYFDASVLVSLFVLDGFSERAFAYVADHEPAPIVSDFAAAEFASALNLRVRMKALGKVDARTAFDNFDVWRARAAQICAAAPADIAMADGFLRRLDLPLRTPDALHIAVARRLDAEMATFDRRMAEAAKTLGLRSAPV